MSAPPGRGPRISAAASRGRSWARILPYPCALEKRLLGDTQTFLGGGGGGGDTFRWAPGPVPAGGAPAVNSALAPGYNLTTV